MKIRLSFAQRDVLERILGGQPFCEYLTPDPRRLAFRTLGEYVPGKLNYVLNGKRVGYRTFWILFKSNLIAPNKYKGGVSPQNGITQFHITRRGWEIL